MASFGAAARTEVCERNGPESGHFNEDTIINYGRAYVFRNRTPAPPPFSGTNSTPAARKAARIASTVRGRGLISPASIRARFRTVAPDSPANRSLVQPIKARAARTCPGKMSSDMTFPIANVRLDDIFSR
jgi:hypothetical protein